MTTRTVSITASAAALLANARMKALGLSDPAAALSDVAAMTGHADTAALARQHDQARDALLPALRGSAPVSVSEGAVRALLSRNQASTLAANLRRIDGNRVGHNQALSQVAGLCGYRNVHEMVAAYLADGAPVHTPQDRTLAAQPARPDVIVVMRWEADETPAFAIRLHDRFTANDAWETIAEEAVWHGIRCAPDHFEVHSGYRRDESIGAWVECGYLSAEVEIDPQDPTTRRIVATAQSVDPVVFLVRDIDLPWRRDADIAWIRTALEELHPGSDFTFASHLVGAPPSAVDAANPVPGSRLVDVLRLVATFTGIDISEWTLRRADGPDSEICTAEEHYVYANSDGEASVTLRGHEIELGRYSNDLRRDIQKITGDEAAAIAAPFLRPDRRIDIRVGQIYRSRTTHHEEIVNFVSSGRAGVTVGFHRHDVRNYRLSPNGEIFLAETPKESEMDAVTFLGLHAYRRDFDADAEVPESIFLEWTIAEGEDGEFYPLFLYTNGTEVLKPQAEDGLAQRVIDESLPDADDKDGVAGNPDLPKPWDIRGDIHTRVIAHEEREQGGRSWFAIVGYGTEWYATARLDCREEAVAQLARLTAPAAGTDEQPF